MLVPPKVIEGGRAGVSWKVTMYATTTSGRHVTKNFHSDMDMYFWLKHICIKAGTLRVVRR